MKRLTMFYLARQNLRRRPFRSLVTILSVLVVAGTLLAASLVMRGAQVSLERATARLGADLMVVPPGYNATVKTALISGEPTTFLMDKDYTREIKAIPGVKQASAQIYFATLSPTNNPLACCTNRLQLIGIDPQTDFTVSPWLKNNLRRTLADDEIILGPYANADPNKLKSSVGDKLKFFGHEFKVAGILEPTGLGLDQSGFVSISAVYEMAKESETKASQKLDIKEGQVSFIMVQLKTGAQASEVADTITRLYPGVAVVTTPELVSTSVGRQVAESLPALLIIASVVWVISVLLIAAMFAMMVNERRREIGLLRAMGATRAFVFRLIILEIVELTALGGLIGVAAGFGASWLLEKQVAGLISTPYQPPEPAFIAGVVVGCLTLALVTGILAAIYPATVSSRLEPYAAIRQGE